MFSDERKIVMKIYYREQFNVIITEMGTEGTFATDVWH